MKYRSILSIFAYMCLTVAITACQDELDISGGVDIGNYGDSYFIIDTDDMPLSRATYNDINNTVFDEGDIVGVFGLDGNDNICDGEENIPYSVNVIAGTLNPDGTIASSTKRTLKPATDKEVKKNRVKYLFYYPYQEDMTFADIQNLKHTVATDQRPAEEETGKNKAYEKSDLLWDIAVPESGGKYCHVKMDHTMANIIVIVDETNYAPDKGVIINGVNITAEGINLLKDGIDNLAGTYTTDTPTDGLNMWGFNYGSGGSRQFRLAVPAQTIKAENGKDFISVQYGKSDKNGNVTYQNKTFNLNKDLVMKPGYNYIFRLSTRPLPIPDYNDDDSWVLDVLDPETGEQVGLLCREYIRYQPQNTLSAGDGDNSDYQNPDQITYPFEEEKTSGNGYKLKGLTMSSQAWVFYKMDKVNSGCPDLTKGQILRVIYDVRSNMNNAITAVGAWPAPYKKENGIFSLQKSSSHNLYCSNHGHNWINDGTSGRSTCEDFDDNGDYLDKSYLKDGSQSAQYFYEFWDKMTGVDPNDEKEKEGYFTMHGSWLWWCPEHRLIYDFKLYDGERVSNQDAKNYGHIAIPPQGDPYVSFVPLDKKNPKYEFDGKEDKSQSTKVGITVPHYLVDTRTSKDGTVEITRYPIVKIGYNKFWMSKSLRTKHLNDDAKTPLVDYSNHPDHTIENFGDKNLVFEPGFVYPWRYTASKAENKNTWDVELLYNTRTILNDNFLPLANINGEKYNVPTEEDIHILWNYLGWCAFNKMQSSDVIPSGDNGYLQKGNPHPATEEEAYARGFLYSNNGICVNVSGFNLKAVSYCVSNGENGWPREGNIGGRSTTLLLKPKNEGENEMFFVFYNQFDQNIPYSSQLFNPQDVNSNRVKNGPSQQSRTFAPIRLFLSFTSMEGKSCSGYCSQAYAPNRPSRRPDAPTANPITRSRSGSVGSGSRDVYIELMSD